MARITFSPAAYKDSGWCVWFDKRCNYEVHIDKARAPRTFSARVGYQRIAVGSIQKCRKAILAHFAELDSLT